MANYLGPKCKLSRRLETDLLLKKAASEIMKLNVVLKSCLVSMVIKNHGIVILVCSCVKNKKLEDSMVFLKSNSEITIKKPQNKKDPLVRT